MRIAFLLLAVFFFADAATPIPPTVNVHLTLVTPKPAPTDPPPAGTPPPAILRYATMHPLLVTMSLSGDAGINARIATEMAAELKESPLPKISSDSQSTPGHQQAKEIPPMIVAQPDWKVADFVGACTNEESNGLGAIIAMPAAQRNATENYFIVNRSWVQLDFDILHFAVCH